MRSKISSKPASPVLQSSVSAGKPRIFAASTQKLDGTPTPRVVLTIAGFDPSSGAGVTADLQTFASHGFFGICAITNLTMQSTAGVKGIEQVAPVFLKKTLTEMARDLPPEGVKIGMVGSSAIAEIIGNFLQAEWQVISNKSLKIIVLDPVLVSSSGRELYPRSELATLHERLLPQVGWVTPNWAELAALSDTSVDNLANVQSAAEILGRRHPHLHIVVTGGDAATPVDVLRLPDGSIHYIEGEHIESNSTHGTGCAFSSALLCLLLQGMIPLKAVRGAKQFVREAILRAPGLGHGKGPLNLLWPLTGKS